MAISGGEGKPSLCPAEATPATPTTHTAALATAQVHQSSMELCRDTKLAKTIVATSAK